MLRQLFASSSSAPCQSFAAPVPDFGPQVSRKVEKQQEEGEKIDKDAKEQLRLLSDTITIEDEEDAVEQLEGEALETVEKYKREATRIVRSGCALHAEPKGSGAIAKLLDVNPAFAMKPDDPQIVLVVYNVNTSGEAITNPSTRVPPLRAHFKKCMAGFMETRNTVRAFARRMLTSSWTAAATGTRASSCRPSSSPRWSRRRTRKGWRLNPRKEKSPKP